MIRYSRSTLCAVLGCVSFTSCSARYVQSYLGEKLPWRLLPHHILFPILVCQLVCRIRLSIAKLSSHQQANTLPEHTPYLFDIERYLNLRNIGSYVAL
jgi:hypothetical protein